MSPYETIRLKYEASEHEKPWKWWLEYHYERGFVFSTPDFFAMGRVTSKSPGMDDCWYIFAFAGDMAKCWSILPWPLPWVAFERILDGKRDLRFYRLEDLRRHTPNLDQQPWAAAATPL